MTTRLATITVLGTSLLFCSCGALEQPSSPQPALALDVSVVDGAPPEAVTATSSLYPKRYCPEPLVAHPLVAEAPLPGVSTETIRDRWDPSAASVRLRAASRGSLSDVCDRWPAPLRFFEVMVMLEGPIEPLTGQRFPLGLWEATGMEVVYAEEPMTFAPFGPSGQTLSLPAGYSLVRRTCGTGEQPWRLGVVARDTVVALRRVGDTPSFPRSDPRARLEHAERKAAEECGLRPPAVDLGRRVSFDVARAVAWSTDGRRIHYLAPPDRTDPTQSAPLRTLDVDTGIAREVAAVADGTGLQPSPDGSLYVSKWPKALPLTRVTPQPDGTGKVELLAVPFDGELSPDGRFLAFDHLMAVQSVAVWDVAARSMRVVGPGRFGAWAADSRLLIRDAATSVLRLSTVDGQTVEQFPSTSVGDVFWGSDGPLVLARLRDWSPAQPTRLLGSPPQRGCRACFGLAVEVARTGAERTLVDVGAGRVGPVVRSLPDVALVWVRRCLGLYETVCSFQLRRLQLPDGPDRLIAVAEQPLPVALAGNRLAIAGTNGIYVRALDE